MNEGVNRSVPDVTTPSPPPRGLTRCACTHTACNRSPYTHTHTVCNLGQERRRPVSRLDLPS